MRQPQPRKESLKKKVPERIKHPIRVIGYYPRAIIKDEDLRKAVLKEELFNYTCREFEIANLELMPNGLRPLGRGFWSASEVHQIVDIKDPNKIFYVSLEEKLKIQKAKSELVSTQKVKLTLIRNKSKPMIQRGFSF